MTNAANRSLRARTRLSAEPSADDLAVSRAAVFGNVVALVGHLQDAQRALEEALDLIAARTSGGGGKGRAFGLTVRALADVMSTLAALSPPETTDARETG